MYSDNVKRAILNQNKEDRNKIHLCAKSIHQIKLEFYHILLFVRDLRISRVIRTSSASANTLNFRLKLKKINRTFMLYVSSSLE